MALGHAVAFRLAGQQPLRICVVHRNWSENEAGTWRTGREEWKEEKWTTWLAEHEGRKRKNGKEGEDRERWTKGLGEGTPLGWPFIYFTDKLQSPFPPSHQLSQEASPPSSEGKGQEQEGN